jgi:hypothetical protein
VKETTDLVACVDMRHPSTPLISPECVDWRHFIALVLGLHLQREAAYDTQPVASLGGGRRFRGPGQYGLGTYVGVTSGLCKRSEVPQQARLKLELKPQSAV